MCAEGLLAGEGSWSVGGDLGRVGPPARESHHLLQVSPTARMHAVARALTYRFAGTRLGPLDSAKRLFERTLRLPGSAQVLPLVHRNRRHVQIHGVG